MMAVHKDSLEVSLFKEILVAQKASKCCRTCCATKDSSITKPLKRLHFRFRAHPPPCTCWGGPWVWTSVWPRCCSCPGRRGCPRNRPWKRNPEPDRSCPKISPSDAAWQCSWGRSGDPRCTWSGSCDRTCDPPETTIHVAGYEYTVWASSQKVKFLSDPDIKLDINRGYSGLCFHRSEDPKASKFLTGDHCSSVPDGRRWESLQLFWGFFECLRVQFFRPRKTFQTSRACRLWLRFWWCFERSSQPPFCYLSEKEHEMY